MGHWFNSRQRTCSLWMYIIRVGSCCTLLSVTIGGNKICIFTYVSRLLKCIYSMFSLAALFFCCDDEWLVVLPLLLVYQSWLYRWFSCPFFRTQKYLISPCMGFTSHLFLFLSPFSVPFKFYGACFETLSEREGRYHNCLQCSKFICLSLFCGIIMFWFLFFP